MRLCMLKLVENFMKYITWGTFQGPLPTKMLYNHKKIGSEGTSNCFTFYKSVHQDLSIEHRTTSVRSISPNPNPPKHKPGTQAFLMCSLRCSKKMNHQHSLNTHIGESEVKNFAMPLSSWKIDSCHPTI